MIQYATCMHCLILFLHVYIVVRVYIYICTYFNFDCETGKGRREESKMPISGCPPIPSSSLATKVAFSPPPPLFSLSLCPSNTGAVNRGLESPDRSANRQFSRRSFTVRVKFQNFQGLSQSHEGTQLYANLIFQSTGQGPTCTAQLHPILSVRRSLLVLGLKFSFLVSVFTLLLDIRRKGPSPG